MAYTKQNFEDGQTLTAEHLNHIEDGIVEEVYIGTEAPTDPNVKIWINPGEEEENASGVAGAVLYSSAQNLAEPQKTQARANIGVYSTAQIDAALGSYIADIAALVGGDA